ncbi:septation protein IspZ, partial [Acinetobacter baumannii]
SMLIVYGALFIIQKFRLDKQQWIVLFMTVIFGGITLMLSDDFYIRLKAAILNLVFAGAFLVSPWFGKERKPLIKRLFDP